MGYTSENDLPFYYAATSAFAISDRYFSSLLGGTLPNRLYYYAGSSFGATTNGPLEEVHPAIFDLLIGAASRGRSTAPTSPRR